jgi:sugar/nucleoside kinase (ribokinase family)
VRDPAGIATVNWTMVLEMTAIWRYLADDILPGLRRDRPCWFIDLADPAKRTADDQREALAVLGRLQRHADVVLGLNEAECRQIVTLIGGDWPVAATDYHAVEQACVAIRRYTGFSMVMCHLVSSSAVAFAASPASAEGSASADGFFEPKPLITTGAGDHFNAGFFAALLAGIAPGRCLQIGGATSSHYVRTGVSPTRTQVAAFLRQVAA